MKPPFGIGKEKWFTDNGYGKPRGTVHVGVNDGAELGWYLQEGQVPILGFEAYFPIYQQTRLVFREEIEAGLLDIYHYALSDWSGTHELYVPINTSTGEEATQGASLLRELNLDSNYKAVIREFTLVERFDVLVDHYKWNPSLYNLLVVDVQGVELQVLKGFGQYLDGFKYLVVECSEKPIYEGESPASEVCEFLESKDFKQMTPILSHNDILFYKK